MDHEVREPRTFTPPPWEAPAESSKRERVKTEPEAEIESAPDWFAAPVGGAAATGGEADASAAGPTAGGETRPDVMLVALAAEETEPLTGVWAVSLGSAVLLAVMGVVAIVVAVVGMSRAHGAGRGLGLTGSLVLATMGFGLLGAAGWMFVRALRQRGV